MSRSLWEHFCRRIQRWSGWELRRIRRLVIEPTNHCTRECPVCGAVQSRTPRARGYMDWDVFTRLLAQAAVLRPSRLCLQAHGESLLHPRLVEMVQACTAKRLHCEIITNGDLLTPDLSRALREAGLGSLILSHPGVTAANYEACRGCPSPPERDEQLMESLRLWEGATAKVGVQSLIIPSLIPDRMDILNFAKRWLDVPGVRDVSFHGYLPWPRHFREDLIRFMAETSRRCELGMLSLAVLWDGTVTPCAYDTSAELALGHFPEASLRQLYKGQALRRLRRSWFRPPGRWPPLCQSCLIRRCRAPLVVIHREELQKHVGNADSEQEYIQSILIPFDHAPYMQRVHH